MLVLGLNDKKRIDEGFVIYQEEKQYSKAYENKLSPFFTIFK
jgi:hypothetical protein